MGRLFVTITLTEDRTYMLTMYRHDARRDAPELVGEWVGLTLPQAVLAIDVESARWFHDPF